MGYKILEAIRQVGKFLTLVTCAIAILHGIIYWKFFAPLAISLICVVAVILWIIGAAGTWIIKFQRSRHAKKIAAARSR